MSEQLTLSIQTAYIGPVVSPNPMVRLAGPGPETATCGACLHQLERRMSRSYWKCSKRGDLTRGSATDQRKRWRACALFQPSIEL